MFLTLVALRDRRVALRACAAATAGAVAGGLLMYLWGAADPAGAIAALLTLPAIGRGMIEEVGKSLDARGFLALFLGPLTGTPYKIYAVEAGQRHLGMTPFLLVSLPARGVRFVVLSLAASWVARRPLAAWTPGRKRLLAIALWTVFYTLYFVVQSR